jgi:hypothetical protein
MQLGPRLTGSRPLPLPVIFQLQPSVLPAGRRYAYYRSGARHHAFAECGRDRRLARYLQSERSGEGGGLGRYLDDRY